MSYKQAALALLCAALAAGAAAGPNEGVCRMQIEADVEKRFGHPASRIEFTYITSTGGSGGGGSDHKSTALVYTDACPGYHAYDVYATEYECEFQAQYGEAPNRIRYRVSGGGC